MTAQPVEAVFFWPLRVKTNFRSIYGRLGTDGYTKDFLQCPQTPQGQQSLLDRVLDRTEKSVTVEFHWPGGSEPRGYWQEATSRGHLGWPTTVGPPAPWRIGDPEADETVTIPGDPTRTSGADADLVFETIKASGIAPWLVAVKLRGEGRVLHLRVYLKNPAPGLEDRSVAVLPDAVQRAMRSLPEKPAGGAVPITPPPAPRAAELVDRIRSALRRGPNVLLVGPPGTGKTVALEDLRASYGAEILFDPEIWGDAWSDADGGGERKTVSLVFHPSYAYENFVAGLVPVPAEGAGFALGTRAGPLLSMAHWASTEGREGLIIIDEFNRGPAAAIFGDTIALLDGDKRFSGQNQGASIERPYGAEPMAVPASFAGAGGNCVVPEAIRLPAALHIVAAMNSSDRSVAPIDAALRRRFEIIEVAPDYDALAHRFGIPRPNPTDDFIAPALWTEAAVKELAIRLLMVLNRRIALILGKDFLLGQAALWHVGGIDAEATAASLVAALDERIVPSLRLTFIDQDEALAAVMGIPRNATTAHPLGFWEEPVGALTTVGQPRLELNAASQIPGWENRLLAIAAILQG